MLVLYDISISKDKGFVRAAFVKAGSITWRNDDILTHTTFQAIPFTSPSGDFDSGDLDGYGVTFTVCKEGTFDYYCRIHQYIIRSITIVGAG